MGLFSIRRKTADRHTFQSFYAETLLPLSRHLQALGLRADEELEDVLQNTYLEAHKSFAAIKDPHAALAWLLTIGRRQFARYVEQRVRQRRLFLDVHQEQDKAIGDVADLRIVPSDERLIHYGLCTQILNMIEQVKNPKKRLALQLFFIEDLALKDIAEQTATNVSTLTTWISRFRRQAQPLLTGGTEDEASETAAEALLSAQEVFP